MEIEDLGGANGTHHVAGRRARPGTGPPRCSPRVSSRRRGAGRGDPPQLRGGRSRWCVARRRRGGRGGGRRRGGAPRSRDAPRLRAGRRARRGGCSRCSILGETGVGKELLARAIHRAIRRAIRPKPFLAINCAALSEISTGTGESELFGHEKGAFTRARSRRAPGGSSRRPTGGTRVPRRGRGDLPLVIQVKLLRVLEQREVQRVAPARRAPWTCASSPPPTRTWKVAAAAGAFREDLYFRLNGISLTVPPLRARPADLPWLVKRFLVRASRAHGSDPAPPRWPRRCWLAALEAYAWPGNVARYADCRCHQARGGARARRTWVHGYEHAAAKLLAAASGRGDEGATALPAPRAWRRHPPDALAAPGAALNCDAADRRCGARCWPRRGSRLVDALTQCDGNQTHAAELLRASPAARSSTTHGRVRTSPKRRASAGRQLRPRRPVARIPQVPGALRGRVARGEEPCRPSGRRSPRWC